MRATFGAPEHSSSGCYSTSFGEQAYGQHHWTPVKGGRTWEFREEAPAIIESTAVPPLGAPTLNKLAVASIVFSILGIVGIGAGVPGIGSLLGVIFGHASSRQIKRSNGTQKGRGFARAGLIVGYGVPVVAIGAIVAYVMFSDCGGGGFMNKVC